MHATDAKTQMAGFGAGPSWKKRKVSTGRIFSQSRRIFQAVNPSQTLKFRERSALQSGYIRPIDQSHHTRMEISISLIPLRFGGSCLPPQ